ncbi:MAG: hypothetical protein WAM53_06015, partial [Terrimicrobiaceae bacterium]
MSPRKFSICEVNFMNGRREPLPFTESRELRCAAFTMAIHCPKGSRPLLTERVKSRESKCDGETAGVHITGIRRRR